MAPLLLLTRRARPRFRGYNFVNDCRASSRRRARPAAARSAAISTAGRQQPAFTACCTGTIGARNKRAAGRTVLSAASRRTGGCDKT